MLLVVGLRGLLIMRPVEGNLLVFATLKTTGLLNSISTYCLEQLLLEVEELVLLSLKTAPCLFALQQDWADQGLVDEFFERERSPDCNCWDPKVLKFFNNFKGIVAKRHVLPNA
jgi:hypothetical protein